MPELIGLLKDACRRGCVPALLHRRSLGMIFEQPSSRQGAVQGGDGNLSAHVLNLRPE